MSSHFVSPGDQSQQSQQSQQPQQPQQLQQPESQSSNSLNRFPTLKTSSFVKNNNDFRLMEVVGFSSFSNRNLYFIFDSFSGHTFNVFSYDGTYQNFVLKVGSFFKFKEDEIIFFLPKKSDNLNQFNSSNL